MIKAYSQRILAPYSGQVQIAESSQARALTIDGEFWEFQFLRGEGKKRGFRRVATIDDSYLRRRAENDLEDQEKDVDPRILELLDFLSDAKVPFPAADPFEYWLLDDSDKKPLALMYSCKEPDERESYPDIRPEWTALPSAVMPIELTEDEKSWSSAPVNYQLERAVAARAGTNPKGKWFHRQPGDAEYFPPTMVRADWDDAGEQDLCQRYLQRQAPRLLMLHNLPVEVRTALEQDARPYAMEVARFFTMYPTIIDDELMNALRVEARLRGVSEGQPEIHKRRDGIYYL